MGTGGIWEHKRCFHPNLRLDAENWEEREDCREEVGGKTVPGQDVAFGMRLQQDGPFPGDETGLWRRA